VLRDKVLCVVIARVDVLAMLLVDAMIVDRGRGCGVLDGSIVLGLCIHLGKGVKKTDQLEDENTSEDEIILHLKYASQVR
jgi:hypothetical protein